MKNLTKLAALATGALLIPTAAAQAATKQVTVGPAKPFKGVPPTLMDAGFYPGKVTIAKGDSVTFKWATGFGDVIFVPKGEELPAFATPVPGQPVSGAKDAAGADLWFNGQPGIVPNMPALSPQGGKVIDGTEVVSSGLALEGPPKPWKVKFPKAGTYTLRSVFHPAKSVKVTVKRSGKGVPTARQDRRALARQVKAKTRLAKRLARFDGPQGNTVLAGNDRGSMVQFAFFPARKTVRVGDTVTFRMPKRTIEIHNVAFGPKPYLDEHAKTFLGPTLNPFVVYRSDAPGTAVQFDGSDHGNGYFNTGILDSERATPFPSQDSVTFTRAGTYAYYCAVHGNDMKGEIVVQ